MLARDEPRGSMLGLGVRPISQLKCIYTSVYSMGNKQEALEAVVQQKSYEIIAINET